MSDSSIPNRREQLELEKLETEVAEAQYRLTPAHRRAEAAKSVAGLTGILTALVAITGLLFSARAARNAERLDQETQINQQVGAAVESLSDTATAKQLSGIIVLRGQLSSGDSVRLEQILSTLGSVLAINDKPIVREAIIATYAAIDTANAAKTAFRRTLDGLAAASRALVHEGKLAEGGAAYVQAMPLNGVEARAVSVGHAITTLLRYRPGPVDLRGIYCAHCDFTGLHADSTRFDDAILALADFSGSSLRGASFDGADLEFTRFVEADARGARFTLAEARPNQPRTSFVKRSLNRMTDGPGGVFLPNFSCADLTDANFDGFPIFGFVSINTRANGRDPWYAYGPFFQGARLTNTNFASPRVFGVTAPTDTFPFRPLNPSFSYGAGRNATFEYRMDPNSALGGTAAFSESLDQLERGFSGTNWREARLPRALKEYLEQNLPLPEPQFETDGKCKPKS